MKINEFINEDFGSIPPLPELILMAVLAKTTVDVIKGSFKVAMKTGKGIKKYRQLHKQAQSMIKNAVIGEIAKSDLDTKMHKMALDRHHAAAIEAMHGLVKKLGQRHTLGYYAATIGRAFAQINPRELEQMYRQKHQIGENFKDGKVKGKSRPGRVKRSGASCNGSVTELRAKAKKASGEKAKMYHWCANMKAGKKK